MMELASMDLRVDRPTVNSQACPMDFLRIGMGHRQPPRGWTWVGLFLLGFSFRSVAAEWYVDPHGSNNNPGTREKPFATLEVARAAFLGGGRDHKVVNNVFVDCKPAVEIDGRGLEAAPVWRNMVESTMRSSLEAVPAALYRERYPDIRSLDPYYPPRDSKDQKNPVFKGIPPEGNVVAGNVCVGPWLNLTWHALPEWIRIENNVTNHPNTFIRPLPSLPRPCDFQVSAGVVEKIGKPTPIPCDQIGLQATDLRRLVESRLKASVQ